MNHNKFAGIGMTSQRTRTRLVERLREKGIKEESVLNTIETTPRHLFLDEAMAHRAYEDTALPIGLGQTISQPYIVARMTELLVDSGIMGNILEIGTGCGYQTAILAQLFPQVYSVERIAGLQYQAQQRLQDLGLHRNVKFLHGDGYQGWSQYAPYDLILVTAAPTEIPPQLLAQLALGGYLILPIGAHKQAQQLQLIQHTKNGFIYDNLAQVNFVPLCTGVI